MGHGNLSFAHLQNIPTPLWHWLVCSWSFSEPKFFSPFLTLSSPLFFYPLSLCCFIVHQVPCSGVSPSSLIQFSICSFSFMLCGASFFSSSLPHFPPCPDVLPFLLISFPVPRQSSLPYSVLHFSTWFLTACLPSSFNSSLFQSYSGISIPVFLFFYTQHLISQCLDGSPSYLLHFPLFSSMSHLLHLFSFFMCYSVVALISSLFSHAPVRLCCLLSLRTSYHPEHPLCNNTFTCPQHSSWTTWPLKMRPVGCIKMSVSSY